MRVLLVHPSPLMYSWSGSPPRPWRLAATVVAVAEDLEVEDAHVYDRHHRSVFGFLLRSLGERRVTALRSRLTGSPGPADSSLSRHAGPCSRSIRIDRRPYG